MQVTRGEHGRGIDSRSSRCRDDGYRRWLLPWHASAHAGSCAACHSWGPCRPTMAATAASSAAVSNPRCPRACSKKVGAEQGACSWAEKHEVAQDASRGAAGRQAGRMGSNGRRSHKKQAASRPSQREAEQQRETKEAVSKKQRQKEEDTKSYAAGREPGPPTACSGF